MRNKQSQNLRINVDTQYFNEGKIRNNILSSKEIKNIRTTLSPQKNYTTLLNNYENKKEDKNKFNFRSISRNDSNYRYSEIDIKNNSNIQTPSSTKANSSNRILQSKIQPLSTRNNNDLNNNYNSESNNEPISIMSLLGAQNSAPLSLKNLNFSVPGYENSKHSIKSMNSIKAYAANTHQGIVRTYNEDRVSIILNIIKPNSFSGDYWPKCSFFGIYDGHGGPTCADFLRDNLHQYIIKDPYFPCNIKEAIRRGFEQAERDYLNNVALNKNNEVLDRSGSCAVISLIVDDMCYIANVGDSRAIMSKSSGKEIVEITNDHKPNNPNEKKRIIEGGGKVYQTQTPAKNLNIQLNHLKENQILVGPYRVFPGRLSVSRSFGDVEAKNIKLGGLPNVIIATPEIHVIEIKDTIDFIIMGCDGIFDQLTNEETINSVWMTTKDNFKCKDIHIQCGLCIDMIIKTSLIRRTLDNVTCVIIAFSNFQNTLFENKIDKNELIKPVLVKNLSSEIKKSNYTLQKYEKDYKKRYDLDISDSKKNSFFTDILPRKSKDSYQNNSFKKQSSYGIYDK